jgi:hypothetical protein
MLGKDHALLAAILKIVAYSLSGLLKSANFGADFPQNQNL